MIDFSGFFRQLRNTSLSPWLHTLPDLVEEKIFRSNNGNLPRWLAALDALPKIDASYENFSGDVVTIGRPEDCDQATRERLETQLRILMPWRKGPYKIFGIHIDTEWHSDWKWRRVQPHITPLADRLVLDVGCGNGYHGWRMLGEGARLVVGIDPSLLYVCQHQVFRHYTGDTRLAVLPFKSEEIAGRVTGFDTVFSMGVLYHRRSPMEHLKELRDLLRPGGELVLETLVINEEHGRILIPDGRYAKMNNVWYIPSPEELRNRLSEIGFKDIRLADINKTSTEEQRSTSWMQFESLRDFLAEDLNTTIEGYPPPVRAAFIASTPD